MQIILPWPDSALSPNSRRKWAKIEAVTALRKLAWATALEALALHPEYISPDVPLVVRYEFYPPNKRHFDLDGLISRCKAAQDGAFDALGINDNRADKLEAERCGVFPGGKVTITIDRRKE